MAIAELTSVNFRSTLSLSTDLVPVMVALHTRLKQQKEKIENFCKRWQITEFALFGSVLRDDFRSDSDIDVLVTFDPDFQRRFTDTIQMREELESLFGRKVDFIVKSAISRSDNWLRKKNILESAEVIYAKK